MLVGVPKEVKNNEYRVALTPAGADALSQAGHQVLVQAGAGKESGFTDDFYDAAGAQVVDSAEEVWARSAMILKVKEPVESEWPLMREGQLMFTYFHFAASEALARAVLESGATAVAYETVETADGDLPLLTPMSEVAGRMAVQAGAKYLERPEGGSGVLLGGVPGVLPAKALILGGGVVGTHAAKMAAGLGARVAVMDISLPRLRRLADILPANVRVLYSTRYAVRKQLRDSDLVVGAVLVPGGKAPCLVERSDLADMRPGSVVVDVAVDQGGCVETIRPTTHEAPVYVVDGVVHYGVSNMPGAVPRFFDLGPHECDASLRVAARERRLEGGLRRRSRVGEGRQCVGRPGRACGSRRGVWNGVRASGIPAWLGGVDFRARDRPGAFQALAGEFRSSSARSGHGRSGGLRRAVGGGGLPGGRRRSSRLDRLDHGVARWHGMPSSTAFGIGGAPRRRLAEQSGHHRPGLSRRTPDTPQEHGIGRVRDPPRRPHRPAGLRTLLGAGDPRGRNRLRHWPGGRGLRQHGRRVNQASRRP